MDFKTTIIDKAKADPKRLVLPEGEDVRTLEAAEMIIREELASELFVLGNLEQMKQLATSNGISLAGVHLIDPHTSPDLEPYAKEFHNLRKHKGMSEEKALEAMRDEVYYGAMMLRLGVVDAMVSGSNSPTAKTVRASLTIVKPRKGIRTVSGSFALVTPPILGSSKHEFVYADSGVVPEPTPDQIADIAIASAETARKLFEIEPKVALLSFSTMGSADAPSVRKMREAVEILKGREVDFEFDGELQFDAAIVPSVAKTKAPDSKIAGHANVMIFPDLNAGNIAYKITQRLAHAEAYGPLLQGLSKPVNDLSRGASPEDILVVSAITLVQAQ